MKTEIDLDAAAAAGVISEDQAIALRNFQAAQDGMTGATSEKFQIFGGYADLVIAVGMAMVLTAIAIVVTTSVSRADAPAAVLALILCVAAAAGSLRVTQRINLRASPAMGLVLTAAFAGFSFFIVLIAVVVVVGHNLRSHLLEALVLASSVAVHAMVMRYHWRAFRFPPTPALVAAGHAYVALTIISNAFPFNSDAAAAPAVAATALVIAMAAMIAGIWWDLTDIRRETERSQTAFWLHCLAGVLMSRALFSLLTGSTMVDGELILTGLSIGHFPWVLAMVLGAAVVSLLLDRRSLLVGCLLPTVGIFDVGNNGEIAVIAGLLLAGTALIFFSAAWVQLRTALLALLPTRIAAQLPRTSLAAVGQRPTRRHKPLWPLR